MKNIFDLTGKQIVLTGGLGLIGLQLAKGLSDHGGSVHVLDMKDQEEGEPTLVACCGANGPAYHQVDITQKQELTEVAERIRSTHGRIDVLINNAALNPKVEDGPQAAGTGNSFETMAQESWDREIAVNLTGTMLCCQVFGREMGSGGSIVNVSSTYGLVAPDQRLYPEGFVKPATYGVTKAAVVNLTQYLASYWGKRGVRVNCVAPGGVENNQEPDFIARYSEKTPLRRMARSDEYNGIMIYLASDASSYSTGSLYVVDGGWTAW